MINQNMDSNEESIVNQSFQRIMLEISVILYFISKNSLTIIAQQYVFTLVANKYNYSESYENCEKESTVLKEVNSQSTLIIVYLNVAELLPTCILVVVLGWWSDVIRRRKFLMWLPCIGNAGYALGFIVISHMKDEEQTLTSTSAVVVVSASIFCGLTGNIHGFMAGNAAYISDTDTIIRRTLRLAIVEAIIGSTFGISNFVLGFWISKNGFLPVFWFIFACSVLAWFILFFIIHEPSNGFVYSNSISESFKGAKYICGCGSRAQKKLWAVVIAFIIYVLIQQGQERSFVLFFENFPICYNSFQIGTFIIILYLLSGFGSWPGIPLLQKCMGDLPIFIIAIISKIIGSAILGFWSSNIAIYAAAVVQLFQLTPYAVGRSIISRQVGMDEQGTIYGILHSLQAVAGFIGPVLINVVYLSTMHINNGLIFVVSALVLVISVVLLLWWYYMDQKDESYPANMLGDGYDSEILTPRSETSALVP